VFQGRAHLADAGLRGRLALAAGQPAVLPDLPLQLGVDLPLQLGVPRDHGRVPAPAQLGVTDQVAKLAQLGQDRRGLRVRRRAHRPGPERLRAGAFQPGKHQRGRSPVQSHPQPRCCEIRAERGGAGLQVDAAEPAAPGLHQRQPGAELGQRRSRAPFQLRQLSPGQPAQQGHGERHRRPAASHDRDVPPRLVRAPGREQRPGGEQLRQVRVDDQPAAAQPFGEP
jgi:hypothetical protein